MVPLIEHSIAETLSLLQSIVASANSEGNVEGLAARYIIGDDHRCDVDWRVKCTAEWVERHYDPMNLAHVSALGLSVVIFDDHDKLDLLTQGMSRAIGRDPTVAGRGSALHDPSVLFGLAVGAQALERKKEFSSWLLSVLDGLVSSAAGPVDPILHVAGVICGGDRFRTYLCTTPAVDYCAVVDWLGRKHIGDVAPDVSARQQKRELVVEHALTQLREIRAAHEAAVYWTALRNAISGDIALALHSPYSVARILNEFEACMRRWRFDSDEKRHPVRWPIQSEREVQDILWLILRSHFSDLEDEDTLPKFGHSTYRADFGIPSLGLLIEVKYARAASDFKNIEKEVMEDIVPYLRSPERYKEILVFIYDNSSSVQEHATTRNCLNSIDGVSGVVIVCKPSQMLGTS